MGPQPCKGKEGREGGGSDPEWGMGSRVPERTAAGHSLELPAWCGDVAAQKPPRSKSSKCGATFLGFIFLLVSKKWAGGNGFSQSMPRMTQPSPLRELRGRGAVKTGRKDHGWHRMQNVGTATRTCNGTCSVPGQNVPAGFSWTSSTLQGKSYVLLLLSWYFILALGASELIKRPFRKRLKLSLKSQGECIVFFSSQALSAMH